MEQAIKLLEQEVDRIEEVSKSLYRRNLLDRAEYRAAEANRFREIVRLLKMT
jgi:uncharacterized protein YqgQ